MVRLVFEVPIAKVVQVVLGGGQRRRAQQQPQYQQHRNKLLHAILAPPVLSQFTLFFWLTWLAVTVTLAICAAGMYFWYIDFKSDKNNE